MERDPVDLSSEITVFVSTMGYPTFATCLERLKAQDCRFRLRVIENVAPMSAALQRMLELCETPYLVQVDEDMLLFPHAVRTLHERISADPEEVVQHVYGLWDEHLGRVIYGLKVNRAEIARRYPIRDVDGCEWDQVRRWRRDGFVDIREPIEGASRDSAVTLGLHGTYWTPGAAYIRFSMLERRRQKGNKTHEWLVEQSCELLRRFLREGAEVDFYALAGVLAGALADHARIGHERDFRSYGETPGFRTLERFVEEVRRGWRAGEPLGPGEDDIDVLPP